MFSGRPSVRACVRASVIHVVVLCIRDISTLQYLLTDFRQTFVTGASRDRDELIRFCGQKVKVQGHAIAAEAHSTRRYRRVQLFLVFIATFCFVFYIYIYLYLFRINISLLLLVFIGTNLG